jgi:DNA-binding transcriptional LysR family regulator
VGIGGGNLNLLVALQALLEEGNVTRAGDRLGMSQPAMSSALSRLRRHYGDELLVRVGREWELTPMARALRPQVQQTMPLLERVFLLDRDFDPEHSTQSFRIAASDYVATLINRPLRARLAQDSPHLVIDWQPLPPDIHTRETGILEFDCMISPRGFGFVGESAHLFHDRFVCIVDPANPWLRDGRLTLDDLRSMPHASAKFGTAHVTPVDRHLSELGLDRRIAVTSRGWLPLLYLVAGTSLIAAVPERLARLVAPSAGVVVVEPPFGDVPLSEALWWHATRVADAGNRWLRAVIQQVAEDLDHSGQAASPR